MNDVRLGATGLELSEIIMGCWVTGGEYWGGADDRESEAAIRFALEKGVTTFDTAYIYGKGHSEEVVGSALEGHRDEAVLITKLWRDYMKKAEVVKACEGSLKRLKTDRLDVYFIHYPAEDGTPIGETMEALSRLRDEGKIRAIGVSNFSLAQMKEAEQYAKIDIIQPCYSLLWRFIDRDILPYCIANNIGVIPYSPIAQGLLTGKFSMETVFKPDDGRNRIPVFQPEYRREALKVVDVMRPVAEKYNRTLAQVAIKWVNMTPGITSAIIGGRNIAQMSDNIGVSGWSLEQADYDLLNQASLAFVKCLPRFKTFFQMTIEE